MKLNEAEKQFLLKNRRQIEPILKKRIEEFKEAILDEPDLERRDRLVKWVKEFKGWLGAIYTIDKSKEDEFTGI